MNTGQGMGEPKIYAVRGWDESFECSQSRRLQNLNWFQMPNRLDSDGYCELMMEPDGPAYYGVWVAMLAIASKGNPRGVFVRKTGQPHTPSTVAMVIRMPAKLVEEAWRVFISIGWLIEWDAEAARLREVESRKRKKRHGSSGTAPGSETSEPRTCVERASNMNETHDTNQPTNLPTNRGARAGAREAPPTAAEPPEEEAESPAEAEPWEGVVRIWGRVFEEVEGTAYPFGKFCVEDGIGLSGVLEPDQRELVEPAMRRFLRGAKRLEKTLSKFRKAAPGLIAEQAQRRRHPLPAPIAVREADPPVSQETQLENIARLKEVLAGVGGAKDPPRSPG